MAITWHDEIQNFADTCTGCGHWPVATDPCSTCRELDPQPPARTIDDPKTGCDHHLAGGPLICTNTRPHRPGAGCVYITGSWVDDRHADGGHG